MSDDKATKTTTTTTASSSTAPTGRARSGPGVPRSVAPRSTSPKSPKGDKGDDAATKNADKAREEKRAKRQTERETAALAEKKTMKRFVYSGPKSSVTFSTGLEVQVDPDTIVELPSEHKYTKALIERGYAVEATEEDEKHYASSDAAPATKEGA